MNLRNQKGINMITLSVAVLILIVITSLLVYSSRDGVRIRNLKDLYNDIELLNNKVATYYVEHGDIPKSAKYENLDFFNVANYNEINPNNGDDYYVIDLKAMEGISLNYGRDYDRVSNNQTISSGYEDLYIINEKSHTIYYPQGIDVQGVRYFAYADDNEWQKVELSVIPISTAEQLAKVGSGETIKIDGENYTFSLDGNYLLKNDIDLSSICYKVDGSTQNDKSWTPIGSESNPFKGRLYGNGHEIKGLYINTTEGNQGLFGRSSGTIQDLTIVGSITTTAKSVGGIAGEMNANSKCSNCTSEIQITGLNYVGGICGSNGGTIDLCKNLNQIKGTLENTGDGKVGGITGDNRGIISRSYNEGNIIAKSSDVGGIAGVNRNTVKLCINNATTTNSYSATGGIVGWQASNNDAKTINCYNLKDINSPGGGIVGVMSIGQVSNCYSIGNTSGGKSIVSNASGTISNCYYLSTLSTTDPNATPKTAEEMKSQAFVDLLNNGQEDAPWTMDTKGINEGYPVLKWQNEE